MALRSLRNLIPLGAALVAWPGVASAQTPTPAPAAKSSAKTAATPPPAQPRAPVESRTTYRAAQPDDSAVLFEDTLDLVQQEYVDENVSREELVEAALQGIVEHLNKRAQKDGQPPVNALLTRRDLGRLSDSMNGEQSGIGMLARSSADGLDVLQVVADSPAAKAGLRAGDRIRSVDGVTVSSGGDLFNALRGEEGTPVRLGVMREPGTPHEQTLDLKITRGRFRVSPVLSRVLEHDTGYIRVTSFTHGTADDVAGDLLSLRDVGISGVILDLRGNPGGSLEEALRIAGMFVEPAEPLLQIVGRNGDAQVVQSEGERLWRGQLAVLVDHATASAAEVLATALHDRGNAVLVGEKTAGKAVGESIFTIPGGGALRLATARYLAWNGHEWVSWAGAGLSPDSPSPALSLDPGEPLDPPLRSALTLMQKLNRPVGQPATDAAPASLMK
ncbi:MAG TPA: S41 family peptidase [bacterium]|nr:S41 family peptidase [bacterium]